MLNSSINSKKEVNLWIMIRQSFSSNKIMGIFVLVVGVLLFVLSPIILNGFPIVIFLRIYGAVLVATALGVAFTSSKMGKETNTPLGRIQFIFAILIFTLFLAVILNGWVNSLLK